MSGQKHIRNFEIQDFSNLRLLIYEFNQNHNTNVLASEMLSMINNHYLQLTQVVAKSRSSSVATKISHISDHFPLIMRNTN